MFLLELLCTLISNATFMAGYVTNSNSFPEQLSQEDEKKYVELYKNGDEKAKNILIEHNLRLVAHIAKKYAQDREIDDLISIGTIGLVKGIITFNPEKNIRLGTYAARCIENEILMLFRSGKKFQNEVSLDEPIGADKEGNTMTYYDILYCDDTDMIDGILMKADVKKLYQVMKKVLKKNEQEIIKWRYGLNDTAVKTQKEIAQMLGISRSYVSRIEKKAVKKLATEVKPE